MNSEQTILTNTVSELRQLIGQPPKTVIVLGSGLADFAEEISVEQQISLGQIRSLPQSTIAGHQGRLVIGTASGQRITVCVGRVHYYEGFSMNEVVRLVRALALLGAEHFVLTNAAGGLHAHYTPGDFVLLKDHINATGQSVLRGANLSDLGPRFPDMTSVYDQNLRAQMLSSAAACDVTMHEGVYVAVQGPAYETPAEIAFYKTIGGDCVGMSTVPEATALRHMGRRVLGVSLVTNLAAGMELNLSHEDVLHRGQQASIRFARMIKHYLSTTTRK